MTYKLEAADRNSKRIVDAAGEIVAWAIRLSNDKWVLNDRDDKRISPRMHNAAPGVLTEWKNRQAD